MLASMLPTGQLSYLGYSKKLIDAVLLVGPVALVTVVYSQLSHLNAEGKSEEFRFIFIRVFRLILFVSIPASILLVMLREPVVAVLFERGKFTHRSTFGTSQILFIYAVGLVTFAVEVLIVYSFYALSNTKVPAKIGIFAVIIDIILSITLVGPFGIAAIAWAYVFSKTLKVVILLLVMNKKLKFLYNSVFINFLPKIIVSCTVSIFCLYLLKGLFQDASFMQKFVFDLAIPAAGFTATFLFCSRLFKIEELNLLSTIVFRRKNFKSELMDDVS
jgi:putative peptidoglycan lipid II flippase